MGERNEKITVIGLGYVGLPLALTAHNKGYKVVGVDIDEDRVASINQGIDPLGDEFIASQLKPGVIKAAKTFDSVSESDVIIICVPTPVKDDYQPDLEPLKEACSAIAEHIKNDTTIIIESTVNPGVCDEILVPLIENISTLKAHENFHLCHCPERINPGDKQWTVKNIPRVIGATDKTGLEAATSFYRSILDTHITPMDTLKEAEAVKVVENSFRDINIAFVNELAMSFSSLGINLINVIDGAATKPFGFMAHYPGVGVGGHCIPVDPYYLIEYAKQNGFEHKFLMLARDINRQMPKFTIQQLAQGLEESDISMSEARVALLGISYKPDVGDDRESPSYKLMELLDELDISYDIYDPYFQQKSSADTLDEVLDDKNAVLVATAHHEFGQLSAQELSDKGVEVIVDGRNCLNKEVFIKSQLVYKGVGT